MVSRLWRSARLPLTLILPPLCTLVSIVACTVLSTVAPHGLLRTRVSRNGRPSVLRSTLSLQPPCISEPIMESTVLRTREATGLLRTPASPRRGLPLLPLTPVRPPLYMPVPTILVSSAPRTQETTGRP